MAISQNLRFKATSPKDEEFDHPPGAALMRNLAVELVAPGWILGEMDNWRDGGWSISCQNGSSKLEIVLAEIVEGEWMLQVAPDYTPGCIGRLFGKQQSATPEEIYELAVAVHRALAAEHLLNRPQWRWDGFPDDEESTPEPQPA